MRDGLLRLPDGIQESDVLSTSFVSSPVAAVPTNGYVSGTQFSRESILWLEWVSQSQQLEIFHALNGNREKHVGPYHLHGYDDNGCFWYECPTCYPSDRTKIIHPVTGQSMSELYHLTTKKMKYLEACGLHVMIK